MKLISLSFACATALSLNAQYDRVSPLFSNNYSSFNPAATGLFQRVAVNASFTAIYPSLNLSYKSYQASYQQYLKGLNGGIGLNYAADAYYKGGMQRATLQYSYQLDLGEDRKLAFGLAAGVMRIAREQETGTFYTTDGPKDYTFYAGNGIKPVYNAGVMYKGDHLSVGASVTQLNDQTFHIVTSENPYQVWDYSMDRNIYLNAAYTFDLGTKFKLEPQMMYHYASGFQELHLNLMATYNDQFWLGANCVGRDGLGLMAGVDLAQRFRLGYAYNVTISRLNNGTSGGVHEFVMRYSIK